MGADDEIEKGPQDSVRRPSATLLEIGKSKRDRRKDEISGRRRTGVPVPTSTTRK